MTEVMIETPQAAKAAMQVAVAKDEREVQLEPSTRTRETQSTTPIS